MSKEKDLEFIKGFTQITVSQICKDLKVDRGNLINGRASEEKTNLIKEEIIRRFNDLIGKE